jgi:SAM-dependent methyltransferase
MTAETGTHQRILGAVNKFYEQFPFPGFDLAKYKTKADLDRQASWWAHKLDAELPFDCDIADIGCGTGQLANFLGLKGDRRILGVDYSQHSLDLAQSLRDKFALHNVRFQRENILELSLPDDSFDYVFCNGVLHHTSDAYGGFKHLIRIARPGGFIVVGLYNRYGRLMLNVRRRVVRIRMKYNPQAKEQALEKQLVKLESDELKLKTWWADQYEHPHETVHTVDEVIDWFSKNGVSYVSSFPKAELGTGSDQDKVFKRRPAGAFSRSSLAHVLVQLGWIVTQNDGGGYFVMVGQKEKK